MRWTIKSGVAVLALTCMLTGFAWAEMSYAPPSLAIEGRKPMIGLLAVQGILREGQQLYVDTSGSGYYFFRDQDQDGIKISDADPDPDGIKRGDISPETIEWFIIAPGTTVLPPAGSGYPGDISNANRVSFTIPQDGSALGKQIGLRITATTSRGLPNSNTSVEILNIINYGGQVVDGTPSVIHGMDSGAVIDTSGQGLVVKK